MTLHWMRPIVEAKQFPNAQLAERCGKGVTHFGLESPAGVISGVEVMRCGRQCFVAFTADSQRGPIVTCADTQVPVHRMGKQIVNLPLLQWQADAVHFSWASV